MKNIIRSSAAIAAAALCAGAIGVSAQTTTAQPVNAQGYPISDAQFARMYGDMDTNKDGMISRAEYINYYGSSYDTWDKDRKGMLPRDTVRSRMFEREMRKSDGNPQGNTPLPGTVTKQ